MVVGVDVEGVAECDYGAAWEKCFTIQPQEKVHSYVKQVRVRVGESAKIQ